MGAYEIIESNGLRDFLRKPLYVNPQFNTLGRVLEYLKEIVEGDQPVEIVGDCDVDGLMCILTLKNGLAGLGVNNVFVAEYTKRMHTLNPIAVQECIQNKCKYCIIADCGSNDVSLLRMLLSFGIKVIMLDHHMTSLDYEEYEELGDLAVINTTLEDEEYALSAGALCFCVMDALFKCYNRDAQFLAPYAIVSLFSDCMCMRSDLNRSIYYHATSLLPEQLPPEIRMFMGEYHKFNNRFITFWMAPRINAMFRSENFDVLNKLFISDDSNTAVKARMLQRMNELYEADREMVSRVADFVEVEDAGGTMIVNLHSVNRHCNVVEHSLWNYTGLLANIVSSDNGKPAFVYCFNGTEYKGSVRDVFGRDLLSIFKQICLANGHKPAFGVKVAAFDMEEFLNDLHRVAKRLEIADVDNKPIVIDYHYLTPDRALIEDVAEINEFAGTGVPVVLLRKQLVGSIREVKTPYNYKYRWEDYYLQSNHALSFGSMLLLRPTKAGTTKLLVQ